MFTIQDGGRSVRQVRKVRKPEKATEQRNVILGEVIKVGRNENCYKTEFTNPASHVLTSE